MLLTFLPRSIRYFGILVLIHVLLFSMLRLTFWGYFSSPEDPVSSADLVQALYIGFKYDLRLMLIFLLVPLFIGLRGPLSLYGPIGKKLWLGYFIIVYILAISLYALHFGHYAYLHQPLNATIFRFFADPVISMTMMWQTYPIVLISLGLVSAIAAYAWLINFSYERMRHRVQIEFSWRGKTLQVVLIGFAVLGGLFAKWSFYPLRWSDAYFSPHPFVAAVAINPSLHLFSTLKNRQVTYNKEETKRHYPFMADYLGVDQPNLETLSYVRQRGAGLLADKRPNVILVLLESFASYKTSLSGNPLNPTPAIAEIAAKSIYFRNFFVPHTGTARSVFTTITGLPDVEVHKTSTRNPLIVDQHSIINNFVDYRHLYFIGGSASWGNVRGLLSHNIRDLELYEEGRYKSPRMDVWGISDLHLFEEANEILKSIPKEKPFFAIIQTSGNHRPYTIPDDNRGFEFSDLDESQVVNHGFGSLKEFNSFRYMDHSIGYFLEQAKKSAYFDNTVFIFYGDHGINADTGKHTPKWEQQLGIHSLRVPLLFYAPKLIPQAEIIDTIASEMDVLPSIAGLAAPSYLNTTLGRNLFDSRYTNKRYAFTVTHGNGLTLGLLNQNFYYQVHESGNEQTLYKLPTNGTSADSVRENVFAQYPKQAATFSSITDAIFETAKYMRYHNKSHNKRP